MTEPISSTIIVKSILLWTSIFISLYIEPQLAGMFGAFSYLIVRHDIKLATMRAKSILIVVFFGWMGAWATVNVLAEYPTIPHVYVQITSATIGFLSYDIMLAFGKNTESVIGFFTGIIKKIILKGAEKWNS